jgi:hypothetical protein
MTTKLPHELRQGDVTKFGTVDTVTVNGHSSRWIHFADKTSKRVRSTTRIAVI